MRGTSHGGADDPCPNCGTTRTLTYCPDCGQNRHDQSRSVFEFIAEFIAHHLLIDAKTVRTVMNLCFRPGRLTRDYIDGKRARYVSPLRVYFFSSLSFFLVLWLSGLVLLQAHPHKGIDGKINIGLIIDDQARDLPGVTSDDPQRTVKMEPVQDGGEPSFEILARPHPAPPIETDLASKVELEGKPNDELSAFVRNVLNGYNKVLANPRLMNDVLDTWLSRMMIGFIPVAAIILALFGWGRRLYFVDHLTFAMHIQAFAFVLAMVAVGVRTYEFSQHGSLLGDDAYQGALLGLLVIFMLYVWIAYRRVYRNGWIWSAIKLTIMGTIYGMLLVIGLASTLVYSLSIV